MTTAPGARDARRAYRILSVIACTIILLALLDGIPALHALTQRDPLYMIVVVLLFGAVFGSIALAALAAVASVTLAADWRLALPAWLYTLAAAMVAVDLLLLQGEADLWVPATIIAGLSLLAAIRAGWGPAR